MNIFGTANSYVQRMALTFKAQQRIMNPSAIRQPAKSEPMRQAEQEAIAKRLTTITGKLKAGKKLSGQDLQFLSRHAPELFEKAVKIAKEREEYQKQLKKCRSKEEVQQLHARKTQMFATEAKAISNANMPEGEKLAKLEELNMRAMAIGDEYTAYVKSERYQRLPDKTEDKKDDEDDINAEEDRIEKSVADAEQAAEASEAEDAEKAAGETLPTGETQPGGADNSPAEAPETPEAARMPEAAPEPAPEPPSAALQQRALEAYKRHTKRG